MRNFRHIQINFVSDSASVYVKARRLLRQVSLLLTSLALYLLQQTIHFQDLHSGITLTGGCLAHQSNLLVKDVMSIESVWAVVEKVVCVSSFVRRSVALRNSLCEYLCREKIPMWLPCESRWYSFSVTLKHVLNIKTAIQVSLMITTKSGTVLSPIFHCCR